MLGPTVWQIRGIPIGGVMSSAAVAVVLGAAELVWLDQRQKHRQLGFLFGECPVRSCISWKRYVDDVVVGSRVFCCSWIFVFLRACYPVPISLESGADTAVHTWVDVELRVVGQHVAVNINNPNRSWVHNRSPQQKSTFLPWTGVLKGGLGSIRGVVLGHLARTKMLGLPEQFWGGSSPGGYGGVALYGISSVRHSGPGSRVAQICRKTVRTRLSFCKERMVDDKKDQRQKPRHGGSGNRRGRSGGVRDSGWRGRRGSARKSSSPSSSSSSQSGSKRRGKQQKVEEAQKLLEKYDPLYQQWKIGGQEEGKDGGIAGASRGAGQGYERTI